MMDNLNLKPQSPDEVSRSWELWDMRLSIMTIWNTAKRTDSR